MVLSERNLLFADGVLGGSGEVVFGGGAIYGKYYHES